MQVIIFGDNRAEFCKLKKNQKELHFFKVRGSQLYKVYPDGLTRMRIFKYGKEFESDEVIVYAENEIIPYHTRGLEYNMDKLLEDIDLHKEMSPRGLFGPKLWFQNNGGSIKKFLLTYGAFLLVGIVALYAILSNGGL